MEDRRENQFATVLSPDFSGRAPWGGVTPDGPLVRWATA